MVLKPVFVLQKERHENLFEVYSRHPEIAQVLVNINFDRPLDREVAHPGYSRKMLGIYINTLFLTALLDTEIVVRDTRLSCGFKPLFSDIQVDLAGVSSDQLAGIASRHAEGIVSSITSADSPENTIVAPLTFAVPRILAQTLMSDHKRLLAEQLQTPDSHSSDSVLYRVSVVGKIYQ